MSTTATAAPPAPTEDERLAKFHAQLDAQKAAVEAMTTFKVNDVSVFDTSPADLRHSTADQAHALCVVLSVAIGELTDDRNGDIPIRSVHVGRAFDAIATLVALSLFANQAA
jgi:hypothetical protein